MKPGARRGGAAGGVRPRLVAVWLVLFGLIGVIMVLEGRDGPVTAPRAKGVAMFGFEESELGALDVLYQGKFAIVMRDPGGGWFLHDSSHRHDAAAAGTDPAAPAETHRADPERAQKVAAQLAATARMRADRRIEPEQGLDAYGLTSPQVMIAFYGRAEDGPDYARPLDVLYVGDLLPTEFAYYARREGDKEISLVPRYYIALLLALIYGEDQAPALQPGEPASSG